MNAKEQLAERLDTLSLQIDRLERRRADMKEEISRILETLQEIMDNPIIEECFQ